MRRCGQWRPSPARLLALAAALALAALTLSGCWDRIELPDTTGVSGAAFDAAPRDGVRVTLALVLDAHLPQPGNPDTSLGPTEALVSGSGPTVAAAVGRLSRQIPGHLLWTHTRIVLIGGALARRGIAPVLDYFMRARRKPLATRVLVTPGEAAPLLGVAPPYGTITTNVLYQQLKQHIEPISAVYRLEASLWTTPGGALVPEVREQPAQVPGAGGGKSNATPTGFLLQGAGVFLHGRLTAWLDGEQLQGAMWLLGQTTHATPVVAAPGGQLLTLRLERPTIARRALAGPGGRPEIRVAIDADEVIQEIYQGAPKVERPGYLTRLSDLLDDAIRRQANLALAAARADRVDFLGFGRLIAAEQPRAWLRLRGDWSRHFPQVPLILRVRTHVRGTGSVGSPL